MHTRASDVAYTAADVYSNYGFHNITYVDNNFFTWIFRSYASFRPQEKLIERNYAIAKYVTSIAQLDYTRYKLLI